MAQARFSRSISRAVSSAVQTPSRRVTRSENARIENDSSLLFSYPAIIIPAKRTKFTAKNSIRIPMVEKI